MNWTVEKLNTLLGSEMGRNPYSQPVFCWKWSNDLFWPSAETGRMIEQEINVPLIGTGETAKGTVLVKEFKPRRMTSRHPDCWIVCRWLPPGALVGLRLDIDIGSEPRECDIPRDLIVARWKNMFPGADYPERSWYMHTDYFCKPHALPTYEDTQFLIAQLRKQRSNMSINALYADMLQADDEERAKIRTRIEDECEDCFTAFLNPSPGKRGNSISFGGVNESQLIQKEN